jgi:2-phospho-L-lactate guanylyltransferase
MPTLAILPIKRFDEAKQRLEEGVRPLPRRALAEAMFADVLVALRRSGGVDEILVVTADKGAQQMAGSHGAHVLDDDGGGHNPAASLGIDYALQHGFDTVVLVPGDCPALDPAELDALIADGEANRADDEPDAVIVPDRHGTGTNALLLTPPDAMTPAFGPGSRDRHVANAYAEGATPEVVEVPTLALDVDTPDDLAALEALLSSTRGGSAHTRGMLSQLMKSRT